MLILHLELLLLLLLHLELLLLLVLLLYHPHLSVLHLLLRHAAAANALADGRGRHHPPSSSSSSNHTTVRTTSHTVQAAGPPPLRTGEGILPLPEGQVLRVGGLLLVADEGVDDAASASAAVTVGEAAGAHPRRGQTGSTAGASAGAQATTTGPAGGSRVGRDHTGTTTAAGVGGPTSTSSSRNARPDHGLELGDPVVPLLDLGLEVGDLRMRYIVRVRSKIGVRS